GIKPSSFGWVPPLGDPDEPLVHETAGCLLLCARREEKVVPRSALNDLIMERVQRVESLEDRKLRSKEKAGIKDECLANLLPRALPRSKQILGYLAPHDDLLVVDTGSATEAEMFLDCLRESLGSLAVVTPQVKSRPADIFTNWLKTRKLPDYFSLGDQCDLLDPEDGATVTCRRQDLGTSEIRGHIDAGKLCTRIGIRWHGDLSLAVDKDLTLKQIKTESSDDEAETEDAIAKLDAAFANMTLEFARFLPALFKALGGETRPA
ncbi:MAG: recombination-associated protein RdgC, partial [Pseudomonadales bacterium]|nr:recombination-associated protein RdgC [Pseudomonadales bacterium]